MTEIGRGLLCGKARGHPPGRRLPSFSSLMLLGGRERRGDPECFLFGWGRRRRGEGGRHRGLERAGSGIVFFVFFERVLFLSAVDFFLRQTVKLVSSHLLCKKRLSLSLFRLRPLSRLPPSMSASTASRRAGGCCASTSAPASGSMTAAAPAAVMTTTASLLLPLRRRRQSSSLDSKALFPSNRRVASISASHVVHALQTEGTASFAGLAAERRRPHRSASSSSSSKAFGLGGGNSKNEKGPVVVIDNYDSFTYNLCQVSR